MVPHTAAAEPFSRPHSSMQLPTCDVVHGALKADAAITAESSATSLIDADLQPLDSELAIEIRAMFLAHWNMDSVQADARMSHFNYGQAVAVLPTPQPGAIGSAFGDGVYAGISRGVDGGLDQHLVLMEGEAEGVTWEAAGAWAHSKGGELPTRAEQSLLLSNLHDRFKPGRYWSSEQTGPSRAWYQSFTSGYQSLANHSNEGRARAVRRLPI